MLDKTLGMGMGGVGSTSPISNPFPNKPEQPGGPGGFDSLLDDVIKKQPTNNVGPKSDVGGIKFSQHALERMSSRGISFKPDDLLRLNEAVDKAAKKGSKESLILMGDNALIVSVKNKTVVTTMDREAMKENVFTNIDSTVIL